MQWLARLSLANRALIALITVSVAFFGTLLMMSLKQELIPSISLPQVSVVTTYRGASPEIVNTDVSAPIESALQGLEGLDSTTTTSSDSRSVVLASFTYGTDIVYAEQRIQQAINRIDAQLPEDADWSVLSGSIDDLPIVQLAFTGEDPTALAARVNSLVVPKLRDLDGVRAAQVSGDRAQRITVKPDAQALAANGLSASDISDALQNAGVLVPAGTLTQGAKTLTVQAGALLDSVDQLRELPLRVQAAQDGSGAPGAPVAPGAVPGVGAGTGTGADAGPGVPSTSTTVKLGEVARVEEDFASASSISRVNGKDALTVAITKRPAANTVDVSREVRDLLPEVRGILGDGVTVSVALDQAPFITDSINTLITEGSLGLGFAVLVIFAFLFSLRATLVTAISIPTSLLVAFIALYFLQYSLNVLTLGALTIAIGRVVDDAIVVVENVRRHVDLHPEASRRGSARARVITGAVGEVATAITASTLVTVAVFLPVVFVGDITGELFRPFGLTATVALLASLVVALTIVPVLAYWFLGRPRRSRVAANVSRETFVRGAGHGEGVASAAEYSSHAQELARTHVNAQERNGTHANAQERNGTHTNAQERTGTHANAQELARTRVNADEPERTCANGEAAKVGRHAAVESNVSRETFVRDEDAEPRNWLQRGYEPILRQVMRRPWWVLAGAVVVLIGTVLLAPLMKTNFLGSAGQDTFQMTQEAPVNSSLATKTELAQRVESILDNTPGIDIVQVSYGGDAFAAFFGGASDTIRWSITTDGNADADAMQADLRAQFEARDDLGTVRVGVRNGFSTDVAVRVTAPDNATLRDAAAAASAKLKDVAGVTQVVSGLDTTRPYIGMSIDADKAAAAGLNDVSIGAQVMQALQPVPIGSVMLNGQSLQMYFVGDEDAPPASLDELRDLPIQAGAETIPLRDLAQVDERTGPVSITAESGTPYTDLTIVSDSDNLGGLGAAISTTLEGIDLPGGAAATLGGSAADQQTAFTQLGLAMLAAILVIYIVMVATLKSLLQPLLLLVAVPFAATGAILLQVLTGLPLGVASLIGVLMLIGIVVTNSIVLVDLVNQFRRRGDTVRRATFAGATRRVRPIIMTALATILALTPMAVGLTGHDGFISQPMALVVIGGLLTSTLLTLVVLPALYVVVEGVGERRAARREARDAAERAAAAGHAKKSG